MSTCKPIVVAAFLFSFTTAGFAQTPAPVAPSAVHGARDPGDAKAVVPTVAYSSAFTRYRANAEVEVGNWRDSNDAVGRIGGWRTYGREASEPDKPDDPANAAAAPRPATGVDKSKKPHHEHARQEDNRDIPSTR